MRSLILCSRSSILDPMSSILEMIWSDIVWNLQERRFHSIRIRINIRIRIRIRIRTRTYLSCICWSMFWI